MTMPMPYHDETSRAAWGPVLNDNVPNPEVFEPAYPTEQPTRLHQFLEWGSRKLGMCGHGAPNNFYVRVADRLFIDCYCCLVWRGMAIGAFIGVGLGIILGFMCGRVF